jgi:MFS family permease
LPEAAGIITAAALGARLGRRKVFVSGLTLFTLASAACAVAPSASALIAARAVQGLGGAAVLPLNLTILTQAFPARRRGAIIGIAVLSAVAPAEMGKASPLSPGGAGRQHQEGGRR